MGDAQEQFQTSKRQIRTVLPIDTTEFPMRLMDWRRIHRKLTHIPKPSSLFSNLCFASIGISSSAFLSLIPLSQAAQTAEPWVKPTFWVVALATAILAAAFHFISRQRDRDIQTSRDEILRDMADIHRCFFPTEDLQSDTDRT